MSYKEALEVFGLKPNFTEAELKKVYKTLLKKYHPDAVAHCDEKTKKEAEEKIREITVAYDILSK